MPEKRYEYDSNDPFRNFVTPIGTLVFPALNEPRDYKGNQQFSYDTGLVLEGEDAEELAAFIDELGEEAKRIHKKPKVNPVVPYEVHTDKDGEEIPGQTKFKFKVAAVTKTKKGDWDRKPAFFDATGTPIEPEPQIGGGTRARIGFQTYLWKNPTQVGVKLQPIAVQVVELVEGGGHRKTASDLGFTPVEGGFVAPAAPPSGGDDDDDSKPKSGAEF